MARLSRDNTSWHAYGLNKRYEDWENDPKPNRRKSKSKNTKRWCRGKEGVEHSWEPVARYGFSYSKCAACGKEAHAREARERAAEQEQKELAAKWCDEGHLWDWQPFDEDGVKWEFVNGKPHYWYKNWRGEHVLIKSWRHPKVHQHCVMCGLERKGRTRNITPEDLQ